jgi:hypothetical protein
VSPFAPDFVSVAGERSWFALSPPGGGRLRGEWQKSREERHLELDFLLPFFYFSKPEQMPLETARNGVQIFTIEKRNHSRITSHFQ